MTEVDVVCWLVEDEETRFHKDKLCKCYESLLSLGEITDSCANDIASKEKPSHPTHILFDFLFHDGHECIMYGIVKIERGEVLSVVANLNLWGDGFTFCMTRGERFKECAFSNAVWPNKLQVIALSEGNVAFFSPLAHGF